MTHALKTWPEYFKEIVDGNKTFEIRKFDRPFNVGDKLLLQEYVPEKGYTGKEAEYAIGYILDNPFFGVKKGYCILSLKSIPDYA
jgi:hypothetical protein